MIKHGIILIFHYLRFHLINSVSMSIGTVSMEIFLATFFFSFVYCARFRDFIIQRWPALSASPSEHNRSYVYALKPAF